MRSSSALARNLQQVLGVVEPVYVEAGLSEQVCVPPLATRHIQNPGTCGESEQVDDSRRLGPISLQSEERLVLEKIVGVEVGLPPFIAGHPVLPRVGQKNTGSRYAPNTSSIAALIS